MYLSRQKKERSRVIPPLRWMLSKAWLCFTRCLPFILFFWLMLAYSSHFLDAAVEHPKQIKNIGIDVGLDLHGLVHPLPNNSPRFLNYTAHSSSNSCFSQPPVKSTIIFMHWDFEPFDLSQTRTSSRCRDWKSLLEGQGFVIDVNKDMIRNEVAQYRAEKVNVWRNTIWRGQDGSIRKW